MLVYPVEVIFSTVLMRSLLAVYILALCGYDKDAGQQGSATS